MKFPVKDSKGLFAKEDTFVVIWTTTPWTIPANVAISLHPDLEYVLFETGGERQIVAKELLKTYTEIVGITDYQVVQEFKGTDLEGVTCSHPIMDRDSILIVGEHVTLEAGTGCVHTAPGHGVEDFEVGKKYKLPVISPLDNSGVFTQEGGMFAGLKYSDANKAVVEELDKRGVLVKMSWIKHQYPHCWRCKDPIIFRATEQWFASIDGFRQETLKAIDEVKWIPNWGRDRIYNMIADRGDWCISRQRTWGVPIPIFYCEECNKDIINDKTINHVKDLFAEHGSDVWFAREANDLIPPGLTCPECGAKSFRKETDIMDVWFDSGSSHVAVLEQPEIWPDLQWPADLYLEGSDQHRGWFNSSLSTAIAARGKAPYKAVLTHGFLVDEQGRKMSKSLGNGIDPSDVIKQMGADILRLWVSSADYKADVAVSPNILKQMTEAYRKIRNTCRYMLGNFYDFDPKTDKVSYDQMLEIDKWALLKLTKLNKKVINAYRSYEFHTLYHAIHNFCAVDMSSFYLDIIKDRLYTSKPDSVERRAAQTVMYEILSSLVRLVAPVLTFSAEEIWRYLPKENDEQFSVQLADMPEIKEEYLDDTLEAKWDKIIDIREEVAKVLEAARRDKVIGHSLNALVHLYPDQELKLFLAPVEKELATIFIVSGVTVHEAGEQAGLNIKVEQALGEKCERCWIYSETVGQDAEHPKVCDRCLEVIK